MQKKILIPVLVLLLIGCLVLAWHADRTNNLPEPPVTSESASHEPSGTEGLKLPEFEDGLGWG